MNADTVASVKSVLPKTIPGIIRAAFIGSGKKNKGRLIKSLLMAAVVFGFNMVFSDAQFLGDNKFLSAIIIKQGNLLNGTLFWTILGANIVNLPAKLKDIGLIKWFRGLKTAFSKIVLFWKASSKKLYSFGVIIALAVSILSGSPALSAITAFSFAMSFTSMDKSKLFYILRLFKAKRQKGKKGEKKLPSMESVTNIMGGLTLGLTLYTIVGGKESEIFFESGFIVFFVLFIIFSGRKTKKAKQI